MLPGISAKGAGTIFEKHDKLWSRGPEGHQFECSHRWSPSPLGNPLLVVAPSLKVMYTVVSLVKELTDKRKEEVESSAETIEKKLFTPNYNAGDIIGTSNVFSKTKP